MENTNEDRHPVMLTDAEHYILMALINDEIRARIFLEVEKEHARLRREEEEK